jgi:hypothetical protein
VIRVLVVVGALAVLAPRAEAKRVCFSGPMRAQIIAGPNATIAGSGWVIVASGTKLPDWRFRDLNRIVRARIVKIAPGLAIYHPPPLAGIDVVLENEAHGVLARTQRALTVGATVGAPRVRSITTRTQSEQRSVIAELGDTIPEHTLLLIASRVSGDTLVPLAWVRVWKGQSETVDLWHTPGSCEQTIPDAIEPKIGDKIVLQWVDDAGRISEPSTAISVVRTKSR